MRYTAIALDYDGTIARDGLVPAHVLVGIFPGIGLFDRVVAENGALLYRPHDGSRKPLGDPAPEALVAMLRAQGVPLSVGDTIVATVRPHETAVLQAIATLGLEH